MTKEISNQNISSSMGVYNATQLTSRDLNRRILENCNRTINPACFASFTNFKISLKSIKFAF